LQARKGNVVFRIKQPVNLCAAGLQHPPALLTVSCQLYAVGCFARNCTANKIKINNT